MKILCAADLHMGRRPSRLPDSFDGGRLSASGAWDDLVEHAVEGGFDAVLLAGDVVDQDNRYFEAYGPLGRGVRRLKEAQIPVVAVAGNHDYRTLHEVAAEVGEGHLRVLGRGGEWERHTILGEDGTPVLHVEGWSFPESRYATDPTADYRLEPTSDGAPVVGLLHCDLNGHEARYAPVAETALARLPAAAWVLGHIHAPGLRATPGMAPVLYPGSLLALNPGERGRHGPWVLELNGGAPRFSHVALSRVRYDQVEVDLEGVEDKDALRRAVVGALEARLERVVDEGCGPLEVLSCRVRLTGRTPLHSRLGQLLDRLDELDPGDREGVRLTVEQLIVETSPALDLQDLARGSDASALLAGLLLTLDRTGGSAPAAEAGPSMDEGAEPSLSSGAPTLDPDLIATATRAATDAAGRGHFAQLSGIMEATKDPRVVLALRLQASRLLDNLMRQKEGV